MRGRRFASLDALIDAAEVKREGIVATTFDVALVKFNRSQSDDSLRAPGRPADGARGGAD
jgi:hypothetical protein